MTDEQRVYSVSELNYQAKSKLEKEFSGVRVEGEVFGLSTAYSGHVYFTLKDESSQISCALFRNYLYRCKHKPQDKDKIIATGDASIYPQRGS